MKCPRCTAPSHVLLTRDVRRRRECFNGHRFTTTEVEATPTDMKQAARVREARRTLRALGYLT